MEFEDEHEEEQEEEEDEEVEIITIPPPSVQPSYDSVVQTNTTTANTNNNNKGVPHRPHILSTTNMNSSNSLSVERRSGVIRYRDCLKNHAVNIGGHAVDGCGEFMPAGEEGTLDALKCAACNCHRNFHRKESVAGEPHASQLNPTTLVQVHTPTSAGGAAAALYPQLPGYYRTTAAAPPSSGYLHVSAPPHRPIAVVPTTSGGTQSGDDVSHPSSSGGGNAVIMRESGSGSSKKRYRTKFSQDQKDKMLDFAEKLGWRIQKHDEAAVQQFCAENQLKRQVLKVWMHNNKHTLGKKP